MITQDAFVETETNEYADVVLPAALWTESDGVMVNSERNLTLFQPAVEPPGQALPDWQIIARIACAMGYSEAFSYDSAEEVFEEIKRFWNPKTGYDLRGVSYDRLRQTPLQWPCPPERHRDRNPIRYLNDGVSQTQFVREDGSVPRLAFPTANGRAVFFARPHLLPEEMPDDDYPFLLNTGRLQHQWHTMTKTGKVAKLNKLNPGPFVEIHPDDAARLQICDGDPVEIASRRGRAVLPAVVTDRVRPGDCFAPFHWNDVFGEYLSINAVTNDAVDPISLQPEFKACAVTLTKVAVAKPESERPIRWHRHPTGTTEVGITGAGRCPRRIPRAGKRTDAAVRSARPLLPRGSAGRAAFGSRPAHGRGAHPAAQRSVRLQHPAVGGRSARRDVRRAAPVARISADDRRAGQPASPIPKPRRPERAPIVVLWASQTGNAEELAADVAARLGEAGLPVALHGMDDFPVADLPTTRELLLITSTTGDGEPPDNGAALWRALIRRRRAPSRRHPLRRPCAGRLQLRRLLRSRAQTRRAPRRAGSDPHCRPRRLRTRLRGRRRRSGSARSSVLTRCTARRHGTLRRPAPARRARPAAGTQTYTKKRPLVTGLVRNTTLSQPRSAKDVRQLVFQSARRDRQLRGR